MSRGLIVVDVQNDFCEGGSVPVAGGARVATLIAGLVERTAGTDYQYVVATRDHHIDPGSHFSETPDYKDIFPVHAWREAREASSTPHYAPTAAGGKVDAVFCLLQGAHSASKSGFEGADDQGTPLADWLRARGVEDVVGIATDHCVRATALDALKAGLRARVLLDYSVGVAPETTASTLKDFRQAGVAVSG
ncbi:isochorismatase family protein (plasmid) [Streptomyces anulatus]|uniref:isochorismatase family protein n=1 Tax=Streptomyces anulatus TaxID=1892 RepID=UPI002F919D24|nr:isochorismatase family protein [Streptomyces anulatus]WTC76501.1 isochorismatase family protein [Streptomyces anulatus]